jgi:RNA polymerase sigma factor (sigma-70 family)
MADMDQTASGLQALAATIRPKLLRFVSARLGNAADAEDVLQELWLRLERTDSGPVVNGEAYLHKVALNLANDLVRQRSRSGARDAAWLETSAGNDVDGQADPAPSPEREVAGRHQLAKVSAAIAVLPERAGDVFRRHRLEGESHAEIAATLGISKSAVEKHMANAIRHLAEALSEKEAN